MASMKTDFSAGSLDVVGALNFATTTGLSGNLFDKFYTFELLCALVWN